VNPCSVRGRVEARGGELWIARRTERREIYAWLMGQPRTPQPLATAQRRFAVRGVGGPTNLSEQQAVRR